MSCVTTPTRTAFETETTESLSTTFSESLTTTPASTSTITSSVCVASASASGDSGCLSFSTFTSISTVAEIVNTVQVPVVITVPVTRTRTETLFGTSCASRSADSSASPTSTPTPTSPPPTEPSHPHNDDFSISTIVSEYTPPPVVVESKSHTTLPNGQVSESIFYSTSQPPPTQTTITTLVPKTQHDDQSGPPSNVGAVIGGALGGFFGLIATVLLGWFLVRRRRRWNDIYDEDSDIIAARKARRFSLDIDDEEPKPYQYGLVGHVTPPPAANSPPTSPTLAGATLDQSRMSKSTAVAHLSISSHGTLHHSRPSTAGSTQSLWPNQSPTPSAHSPASSITRPAMQHAQQEYFSHIDVPERVGSPTSIREPPRRLQVANETRSPTASVFSLPPEDNTVSRQSGLPADPPAYSKD